MASYESTGPAVHEGPPTPPSPKFAGWRDPFADPWANFKGKKSPHVAQSLGRLWHGREASPPLSSASPSPARSPVPFEPKLVIVKGWCRYQDPKRSFTQEEARDVGAHLMELMGGNFCRLVIFQDPLLQNSRFVFRTHNTEDTNIVKTMLTERFNMKSYLIKQTPVFAMLGQSTERRECSATIAKANGLLEDAIGSHDHICLDVRAGSSYFAPNVGNDKGLKIVGNSNAPRRTWSWSAEALRAARPTLDVEELKKNTERIMNR